MSKPLREALRQRLRELRLLADDNTLASRAAHRDQLQVRLEEHVAETFAAAGKKPERRFLAMLELGELMESELSPVPAGLARALKLIERRKQGAVERFLQQQAEAGPTDKLRTLAERAESAVFAGAVREYLREQRVAAVLATLSSGVVGWDRPLTPADRVGAGMDERAFELPLAVEAARLDGAGVVLDAGASLNQDYLRSEYLHPEGRVIHYTQSASGEEVRPDGGRVSYMFGDLRALEFRDGSFDRVLCISTLEHVGMDNSRYGAAPESAPDSYLEALSELWRVVRPGGLLMLTAPFGVAARHGWFQTFDEGALVRMREKLAGGRVDQRFFCYAGCWVDGQPSSAVPAEGSGNAASSIPAVLATDCIVALRAVKHGPDQA